jgi:putative FmdB family regulatory protein
VPIFVYRCGSGHRFERLLPRDAEAPACPECGSATRKIPAGPSLARGASRSSTPAAPAAGGGGSVPIPWRGVVSGGPEKMQREIEFRQRLEAKGRSGLRTPGGPERATSEGGGKSGSKPADAG